MSKLISKAIKPEAAKPSKPKILIFGKAGVGKTWASLDFPKTFYIDTEGGANLEHYTDKLSKAGGMYFGVEQGSRDFATVVELVKELATTKHEFKTIVIDSVSKLFNNEITKEAERLGDKDAFGASKKPAVALTRRLINWIDKVDMNVILISHEKAAWENGEQKGFTFDAYEKLEYELHLCLHIQKLGASRKAFVRKSRIEQFADASSFDWGYKEFAKIYGEKVIESSSQQIVLATPEQVAEVNKLLTIIKMEEKELATWFSKAQVESWDEMSIDVIQKCINNLKGRIA